MYEWVIGFGKEINLFWKERVTAATVLFLLNRYAPLVYFLSSFSGSSAHTDKVSTSADILHNWGSNQLAIEALISSPYV